MKASSQCLIETIDLTRIYGDGEQIRALDGVNLKIEPGELVTVMGPSGSGKSTLLNIIGALDKPTEGQVFVDGENVQEIRDKDNFRAEKIGFIFQLHNLLPTMTALENIEIPMNGRVPASERKDRAKELLNLIGLGDRPNHLPSQLSGGQRQRVAVARALANHPPLVLADEPTGSLDSKAGRELMELLKDLNQTQGVTFLVVTHDPSVARQTNRVLVMEDGKIVREDLVGSPIEEDLKIWRHSGLGRRFIENDMGSLRQMGVSQAQAMHIKELLATANEHEDH